MADPVHGDKLIEKMEEKTSTQPLPEAAVTGYKRVCGTDSGHLLFIRVRSRPRFYRPSTRGGAATLSSLAIPSIRAVLTTATAGTDGILLPTSSQEEVTAVDAAADAAVLATAATTTSRFLSPDTFWSSDNSVTIFFIRAIIIFFRM
jgi:hypothetical protein